MKDTAFKILSNMENSWWYRGRAKIVQMLLTKYASVHATSVLDYGAGNGGMLHVWTKFSKRICAFEPTADFREGLRKRNYCHVYTSEEEALGSTYDIIALCDVLEHIEDDIATLRKVRAALSNNGVLIVTVPAFQWLWSGHDKQHHHFRRYTSTHLRDKFKSAGLEVVYLSYWNMLLFIPAAIVRFLGNTGEGSLRLPGFFNACFFFVLSIEIALMRLFRLPFGLSVVIVGRRMT